MKIFYYYYSEDSNLDDFWNFNNPPIINSEDNFNF